MRTVGQVLAGLTDLTAEAGLSRDLPAAATALLRGEVDVAFGRVHSLGGRYSGQLTSRLARLEPVDAIVSTEHPLAGRPELRPADLRQSRLWCPAAPGRLDFLQRFAAHFGLATEHSGANLGLDHLIDRLRADPRRFSLLPAEIPLPAGAGVRSVPLTGPTPLYAWSLVWRSQDQHPQLGALLQCFAETGGRQMARVRPSPRLAARPRPRGTPSARAPDARLSRRRRSADCLQRGARLGCPVRSAPAFGDPGRVAEMAGRSCDRPRNTARSPRTCATGRMASDRLSAPGS